MITFYSNASRSRLFWLALHMAGVAVLTGYIVTSYVEDWRYVSDSLGRLRTIAGGCAWAIACVSAGSISLICVARLPRRPTGTDSLGYFDVVLLVEMILYFCTGLLLDTGVLQSHVVFGSLVVNVVWLATPQLTNEPTKGK